MATLTDGGTAVNEPGQPVPQGELRVSDQERDATVELLGRHAAAGRLTLDEHEERAARVLQAKTRGDLAAVTNDLPVEGSSVPETRRPPVRWMVAIMSGSHRRGRFRPASVVNAISIMGGDEIDLRDAELEGGGLTLNAISVMGGSDIYLPDTVDVEVGGISIMGGNQERGALNRPRPGAPVVRIRTYNLMGGITVWRLPRQARGLSLKEGRRLAKAAERGRLPALE
jgi:hypothetical protein